MGPMWSDRTRPPVRRLLGLGLVGGLALGGVSACGDETAPTSAESTPSRTPSSDTSTEPSTSTTPDASASTTPEPEPSDDPTSSTTVPVYFVADAPQGQRLFREFRAVDADDPLVAAGALLTGRSILDPDYTTLLPRGSFADVRDGGDELEVVLADPTWSERPAGMSAQQARLAVQQVVYTLQGVVGSRDPVVAYAEDGGRPVDLFGVPTVKGVTEARPLKVLGLVNVTSPEEATTVGRSFVASGVASSFEANVPWEVREGSRVVLEGNATAEGYLGKLYPWQADVDVSSLASGTYTFVAMTDDPSGGEGFGPTEDTKDFTVE